MKLYACPFCLRRGFTSRGLRAHWCKAKGGIAEGLDGRNSAHSRPLTKEEWLAVVHPEAK